MQEAYLYIEDETITGITGFGQARFGDPARDLAWVVSSSSDEFARELLAQYHQLRLYEDPKLSARIELNSELVLLEWLMHGVRENNESIIADARELISQLADTLDSTGLLPALRENSGLEDPPEGKESEQDEPQQEENGQDLEQYPKEHEENETNAPEESPASEPLPADHDSASKNEIDPPAAAEQDGTPSPR